MGLVEDILINAAVGATIALFFRRSEMVRMLLVIFATIAVFFLIAHGKGGPVSGGVSFNLFARYFVYSLPVFAIFFLIPAACGSSVTTWIIARADHKPVRESNHKMALGIAYIIYGGFAAAVTAWAAKGITDWSIGTSFKIRGMVTILLYGELFVAGICIFVGVLILSRGPEKLIRVLGFWTFVSVPFGTILAFILVETLRMDRISDKNDRSGYEE